MPYLPVRWGEQQIPYHTYLAFWPAYFYPSVSGGLPPRLLPPSGGLGLSPGAWGTPNKGNADGAGGIFGTCRMRVGYGPAPGPTIKRPCAILARSVGRATNTILTLVFWPAYFYPSVSGGLPPRLLPPSGGLGLSPGAWGAPNKGNADGAGGIFGTCRMRVGYGPASGPTIKRPCAILARSVGRATNTILPWPFGWVVWHSCWMGYRNQEQTRGRIGPQLWLGNLRVGELLFQIRFARLV